LTPKCPNIRAKKKTPNHLRRRIVIAPPFLRCVVDCGYDQRISAAPVLYKLRGQMIMRKIASLSSPHYFSFAVFWLFF
jgi:hypothetical protein